MHVNYQFLRRLYTIYACSPVNAIWFGPMLGLDAYFANVGIFGTALLQLAHLDFAAFKNNAVLAYYVICPLTMYSYSSN